jgi:hypothetical protein
MARRYARLPPLSAAAQKAKGDIRKALKAAEGTGDYSGVRAAIRAFLIADTYSE